MLKPLVVLSALVVGTASMAHADTIYGQFSVFGDNNVVYSSSTDSGTVSFGPTTVSGALTGTFATYLQDGDTVTFLSGALPFKTGTNTPPLATYPTGVVPIFTVTGNSGEAFTFDMTSYTVTPVPGAINDLLININGTISATAGSASLTPGSAYGSTTFQFQTSDSSLPGYPDTFSGEVVAPTPEPSSLALLGTGLLGAVGIARRKMRV